MEENEKSLLYFGIQKNTSARKTWWQKCAATVYRCQRKGKIQGGRLQYFYVPVPEYYCGKKTWKAEKLHAYLQEAMERVRPNDYYLHPEVCGILGAEEQEELPPVSLMEAMLSECRKAESLEICLPEERQTGVADLLIHLLTPYLPRVNTIAIIGGEESLFEELEEYFYEEYGIVVSRAKKPGRGPNKEPFIINLWSGEGETVKFLDTMVKNGYNTKVN